MTESNGSGSEQFDPSDPLHGARAAAKYIGRPQRTLQDWRYRGTGPAYVRINGRAYYRQSDLQRWMNAHLAHLVTPAAS